MYQMAGKAYTRWLLRHMSTYAGEAAARRSLAQYKSFWKHFKQSMLINICLLCHSVHMTGFFFLILGLYLLCCTKDSCLGTYSELIFISNILVTYFTSPQTSQSIQYYEQI